MSTLRQQHGASPVRAFRRAPAVIHLQVRRAYGAESACGRLDPDDELTRDPRQCTCTFCQMTLIPEAT